MKSSTDTPATGVESSSQQPSENGHSKGANRLLLSNDSNVAPVVSVVMPTLNEEEGIGECISRIKNALLELGVPGEVIVSDSSTDRTPEIAEEMGATVVTPDKPGYGYAYRYGFQHARGEYIVIGDADTTYDFEEIPKLLTHLEETGADMVMGSRLEGEIRSGSMPPLHEHIGNPLLTKFLNVFYDAGVSDAHSGFRVIRRSALEDLDLTTDGMEFASEMIMEAGARGLQIEEVPIVYHEREGEATLDSFHDGWRHVRFMLLNAPGYLFSVPGAMMAGFGTLLMILCLTGVDIYGWSLGLHSMVAGSLLTIVGAQVGSLGVFASVASNPIRQASDPLTEWVTDQVRLEHGATAGLVVFGGGAVYAAVMIGRWVASGFAELSMLMIDIFAFTAIVLGLQMIFSSFFLSAIAD